MFGRSKPVPFKPYALRASKPARRMPRWLIWLLVGVVLGVAGVIFVQQNYMAPRLTAQQSRNLTDQLAQARAALASTQSQLEQADQEIRRRQVESDAMSAELDKAKAALQPLEESLALLQKVLPPDPRGGDLQIRAGRFFNEDDGLAYHIVLTHDDNRPFKGQVQFAVEGRYPNGRTAVATLDPIALQLDGFGNMQGVAQLPDGMRARQITVRVLDAGERVQAMRVINTRN